MNLVCIHGGLGNQMFEYTFARALERFTLEPVVLDDLDIQNEPIPGHNGLELKRIFPHQKGKYISDFLSKETCQEIIATKAKLGGAVATIDLIKKAGVSIDTISFQGQHFYDFWKEHILSEPKFYTNIDLTDENIKNPSFYQNIRNTYFFGVWQFRSLYISIKDEILEELAFPPLTDEKNLAYYQQIENAENAVGIHVRRGDFSTVAGLMLSVDVYREGIEKLKKEATNPTFFICSDDLPWCKENQHGLGLGEDKVIYIDGNTKESSYKDMQLLSYCDYLIGHHFSTFIINASRMNQKLKKIIRL